MKKQSKKSLKDFQKNTSLTKIQKKKVKGGIVVEEHVVG